MKFAHLIAYNKRNIFLQISCGKSGRETSSRPLLVFKKVLYVVKSSCSAAHTFRQPSTCHTMKAICTKFYTIYRLRDMLDFDFLEKDPYFVYDF